MKAINRKTSGVYYVARCYYKDEVWYVVKLNSLGQVNEQLDHLEQLCSDGVYDYIIITIYNSKDNIVGYEYISNMDPRGERFMTELKVKEAANSCPEKKLPNPDLRK